MHKESAPAISLFLSSLQRRFFIRRFLNKVGLFGGILVFFYLTLTVMGDLSNMGFNLSNRSLLILAILVIGVSVFMGGNLRLSKLKLAGKVDRTEGLKDKIKSAYWFSQRQVRSDQVKILIDQATQFCRKAVPSRYVKLNILPNIVWIGIVIFAFWFITSSNLNLSHLAENKVFQIPVTQGAFVDQLVNSSSPEGVFLDDQNGEDETLVLEQRKQKLATVSFEDLSEIQDVIDMRAVIARDGLDQLADALEGRPSYEKIVDALREERLEDAVAMLSEMAKIEIDKNKRPDPPTGLTDLQEKIDGESKKDFLKTVEDTSTKLGNLGAEVNNEALQQALQSIEDAQSMIDDQDQLRQLSQRTNSADTPTNQLSPLTAARFGDERNPTEPQAYAEPGSTNMQGGTMFRQGAIARGEADDDSEEGYEAGAASGNSEAAALEGDAMPRIEVNLELEKVRINDGKGDGKTDGEDSWFFSPTEADLGGSSAGTGVEFSGQYASSSSTESYETPIRQRSLVREYFINVHKKGDL